MKNKAKTLSGNKKTVKPGKKKTTPPKKSLLSKTIKKNSKAKTGIQDNARLRKPADKKLNKQNAARYRNMIENIDNGYFEVDLAGNFTFFNDEVCRALGYSRKELMVQNYRQHTDKETAKKIFQTYNKVYRTGKTIKGFGYYIKRKDGSKRYIEGSVSLRRDSSGKPIGFLGITNDFTRRKQLADDLRKSESLYHLLADHMRDQISLMDLNLKWKYISPSVEKLLGYSLKELKKIPLDNLLTEPSFKKAMNIFSTEMTKAQTTLPHPSMKHILELEFRHKDGQTLWIEGTFSFIQDKDGKPVSILGESRDITERKRVEEALRQSEEKYRTILQNIHEGYFEVDLAGNFTFFNDSLCRIDGYSKEELMGMNYRQLMDEETAKIIFQAFNTVYKTGNLLPEINYQIIRKDGVNRYSEASVSLLKDSSDKAIGFRGIIRDITDRKQAEHDLLASETRYRRLFQCAKDGVLIINAETGAIEDVNPFMVEMLGFSYEYFLGKKLWDIGLFKDIASSEKAFKELQKKEYIRYADLPLQTSDGRQLDVEFVSNVYLVDSAKVIQCNIRDITERKRMEKKLWEEEQRFRALAEQSSDIIVLVNREGIITYENPAVENTLGFKVEERIGSSIFDHIHPDDFKFITEIFNTLFGDSNAPVQKSEMRLCDKGGSWHTFEAIGCNLANDNVVNAVIVNLRDITERKKAEEALRESENRYRELSIIDDLTQLYNSRHFHAQLKKETERSNRHEQPLTLMLLDIDKFKDFNDTYGHLEGDHVLSKLGQVIKRCLREIDTAYRYGGEEFTIMLPMTTAEEGIITAKRIQAELKKEAFSPISDQKISITMSIGLAQHKPKEDVKMFIRRADQLMYKGKKNGRDKICSDDGNVL